MGLFLLYTQTLYTTPSLSLSQFEGKRKNRKERHLCPWTVQFIIHIWHFESVSLCVLKDSCIFMLPRGLSCSWQFYYEFVVSHFLFSFYSPYVILLKSKVGDHSRGWPEGSLFDSLLHQGVGEGATPFPGLLHFTLDPYLTMLSVKQGGIKYHFLSLWYDSTWDWTQVSRAIGEHSNR